MSMQTKPSLFKSEIELLPEESQVFDGRLFLIGE